MIQLSSMENDYLQQHPYFLLDKQFYPKMNESGGMMLIVDCDNINGGMKIRNDFMIDFGKEPNGPLELTRQDNLAVIVL